MSKRSFMNYKLSCTSPNCINLLNICNSNNIKIYNINKKEDGVEFDVSSKDYEKLVKLDLRKYNINIIKKGGFKVLFNKLFFRSGLIVGLILCLLGFIFLNNRLLQIHVTGLSKTSRQDIIEELKINGITNFSLMNFDVKNVENLLSEKFDFSLVSIITKGNSLIINVKESLPKLEDLYVPITADYNMVIKSIDVYSGTTNIRTGDIVYKGDILVQPYVKSNDSIVYVTPCAKIVSEVFFNTSLEFKNNEKNTKRTGKKQTIKTSLYLGKKMIYNNKTNCKFDMYEIENKTQNISNYFLPLKLDKVVAYQIKEEIVTHDFNAEKDKITKMLKLEAYSLVPSNIKVEKEDVEITETNEGYIVNVYLSSIVTRVYEYHG